MHHIVQSSQQPSNVRVVLTATVQIRQCNIASLGVLPRVLQTDEKRGCEPTLVSLKHHSLVLKLLLRLTSIWSPWTPRPSICELQKGMDGEYPECIKGYAFSHQGA